MKYLKLNGNLLKLGNNFAVTSPTDVFKLQITTTSTSQSVTIPHSNGYVYNYSIDYGDNSPLGTVTTYNGADCTHTYTSVGSYVVSISGICESISYNNGAQRLTLTKILQWGNVGLKKLDLFGCANLIEIPNDLVGGLSKVTTFHWSFLDCSGLVSLPVDLFRYNNIVEDYSAAFAHCTSLVNIPSNLFKYNTAITSFSGIFQYCSSLEVIPPDLFKYNTNAQWINNAFQYCTNLTTIPDDLFRYNTNMINYEQLFSGCNKLQLNPWTFYANGEQTTRFAGKTLVFNGCFERTSFTGVQGTAPDLWNCTMISSTKTGCFGGAGNSLTSISNYGSIPVAWI